MWHHLIDRGEGMLLVFLGDVWRIFWSPTEANKPVEERR